MEQRLRGDIKRDGCLWHTRWSTANLYLSEVGCLFREPTTWQQEALGLRLFHDSLLFHLGGTLHPLGDGLTGEACSVGLLNTVAHKEKALHHQNSVGGQELHERNLLTAKRSQLRYNLHRFLLVARQLTLYFEGADGIDLITEEIQTEGVFGTKGEHIQDTTAHGKLSWLIHIFHLLETQLAQLVLQGRHLLHVPHLQHHRTLIQLRLRDNQLSKRLRMRYDEERSVECGV